jgi:hypothetical protein
MVCGLQENSLIIKCEIEVTQGQNKRKKEEVKTAVKKDSDEEDE